MNACAMAGHVQGIAELVERVAKSLAGVRVELRRVTRLVRAQLQVLRDDKWLQEQRVAVTLVADHFQDVMSATLQVSAHCAGIVQIPCVQSCMRLEAQSRRCKAGHLRVHSELAASSEPAAAAHVQAASARL